MTLENVIAANVTELRVLHGRDLVPGHELESTSRYRDDIWHLHPAQQQVHERSHVLDFTRVPDEFREVCKQLCYALLSLAPPAGQRRPSISTVRSEFTEYVRFLRWLGGRSASSSGILLESLTDDDFDAYERFLLEKLEREGSRTFARYCVRRFWLWRAALSPDRLTFDPYESLRFISPRTRNAGARENSTPRIPEPVITRLVYWAMRYVDGFAEDVLAADVEWRRLQAVKPASRDSSHTLVDDYLVHLKATNEPVPAYRGRINCSYISRAIGASRDVVTTRREELEQAARLYGLSEETLLRGHIRAEISGRSWVDGFSTDHTSSRSLARRARELQTACYILVAYLSGMRDSEIKHIRRGSVSTLRSPSGGPYRWRVESLTFKGERRSSHGKKVTWTIGAAAARALEILERLQPANVELLFSGLPHGAGHNHGNGVEQKPRALTNSQTNQNLQEFVDGVNQLCEDHAFEGNVPEVDGARWRLHSSQFRRTLAWFIARQPGGSIAGALQYKHHSIQMFEGYAGTSDSGFRAEVESEQALARGEELMSMVDRHEHQHLAGPASDEARRRLEELERRVRFPGKVVPDERRLLRVMTKEDPAIFRGKYSICVHDPDKALCERGKGAPSEGLPDLGECLPTKCRNAAFDADNRAAVRQAIADLDVALNRVPALPPLLEHRVRAQRLELATLLSSLSAQDGKGQSR